MGREKESLKKTVKATVWESHLREIKGMRNEMRVSEHLQAQNLVTFCAFRLYTHIGTSITV